MKFDVAVIGGGPAGLSSCIFLSRAGLNAICFEKLAIGGQASLSYEIANYPGINSISGYELTQKMFDHAKEFGTTFYFSSVEKVNKTKTGFSIKTKNETIFCRKVIIAIGTVARKLGLNEEKYIGKGISYCASCDGNFFKGKPVAIVGGGDSAFSYAEYLSRIASKVYVINRSENFKAHKFRIENVKKLKNVQVLTNVHIQELLGEELIEGVKLSNGKTLKVDGVFVAIGHEPKLDFLNFHVDLDKHGYIIVDKYMQTSEKNVYACGDITSKHFKQIITACADGAIAGNSCVEG